MKDDQQRSLLKLFATSLVQSFVVWFVRIFVLSWYIYFAIQFFDQNVEGDRYVFWVIVPLSTFGLWQLIEMLAKALKLTAREPRRQGDSQ